VPVASSSAASERKFSTMGSIHSKLRNCLGRDTVEKLVYVKTNNLQFTVNANLDAYNIANDNEDDSEWNKASRICLKSCNRKTIGFIKNPWVILV
jgi:hypothetical protein